MVQLSDGIGNYESSVPPAQEAQTTIERPDDEMYDLTIPAECITVDELLSWVKDGSDSDEVLARARRVYAIEVIQETDSQRKTLLEQLQKMLSDG